MKSTIHPTYFVDAQVTCSCGNTFATGSTKKDIHVEICYKCHPLYTGEKRYVDTLGQVGKFQQKQKTAQELRQKYGTKKVKKQEKEDYRPKSLKELLTQV